MVFLLGPIRQVAAMGKKTFAARMIENGPRNGQVMPVEEDTHSLNLIAFENGVIGEMMVSFDVWESETPRFEIYGEDGTICIPDADPGDGANIFHGPVWYRTRKEARWSKRPRPVAPVEWCVAENTHGFNYDARGVGLLEMADAVANGRTPRASGALAYHITEAMQAMLTSAREARFVEVASTCARPQPLPENFPEDC
jgi:predicted dehydrogenase